MLLTCCSSAAKFSSHPPTCHLPFQAVCELLTSKLVRYKAFDLDPYRVAEARALGLPVFYGDARRPDVLQAHRYALLRTVTHRYALVAPTCCRRPLLSRAVTCRDVP